MALDQSKLEKLLQKKGSEKAIVAFFKGASEKDRKQLSGFCVENLKSQINAERQGGRHSHEYNPLISPATYAAYCTSTFSQSDLGWRTHINGQLVYQLLADRHPHWLDDWVQECCNKLRVGNYREIRQLTLDGTCTCPTSDNFVRMMTWTIGNDPLKELKKDPGLLKDLIWRVFETPYVMHHGMQIGYLYESWANALVTLSQKGQLDRRRLFEGCFTATNMGFNREQIKVFLQLHDQLKPTVDERLEMVDSYCGLLDSSLPAVIKFAFDTLHQLDKESPLDEQHLCDVLRATVRSTVKSQVKSSLKWLGSLCKRQPKCVASACLSASEALLHEKADVQAEAWAFIEKQTSGQECSLDDLSAELERLAPTASASVRKKIVKWLRENSGSQEKSATKKTSAKKTTGKEITTAGKATSKGQGSGPAGTTSSESPSLHEALALVKKVNRKLAALQGFTELVQAVKSGSPTIPPCRFQGDELTRLNQLDLLGPIDTLEDFVETTARALEDPTRIDDVECVFEALTRFSVDDDEVREAADPIIQRAVKLSQRCAPFYGAGANQDLIPVVAAWSGVAECVKDLRKRYTRRDEEGPPPGLTGFLGFRSRAIMKRFLDKQPLCLLAAPTHAGGWIDPLILAKRIKAATKDHLLDFDQALALLRMAPDNRGRAMKVAKDVEGEFAAAFRYACGDEAKRIGKTHFLWVNAARARAPFEDDPRVEKKFPQRGVDAGRAAQHEIRTDVTKKKKKKKYDWDSNTLFLAAASPQPKFNREHWRANRGVHYLLPTTLPYEHSSHSDCFLDTKPCQPHIFDLAATVWPLNRESYFLPENHVRSLFDPNAPLLELSSWGMVRALGHGWTPHRTMGVDLAIAAIEDGRWDAPRVGRLMAVEFFYAHRFVKSLPEVASCSPLHSLQVAMSLQAMLAEHPKVRPASLAGLLEISYELLEEL